MMSTSPTSSPRVLIIGAGVGGLAMAQGLQRLGIAFDVFERDTQLDSRRQGYRLKILGDIASKLRSTITEAAWTMLDDTCARPLLGETNLNATSAITVACRRSWLHHDGAISADRGILRQALIKGIENKLHFGKSLTSYEITNNGRTVRACFSDGSSEVGDLIIGADGSHSAVRAKLIPSYQPLNTGICCVYGKSPLSVDLCSRFPERHRRWITVVQDHTPTIESIKNGDKPVTMVCEPFIFAGRDAYPHLPEDYVHWGILFHEGYLGLSSLDLDNALRHDSSDLALGITSEWHESIRSLIELHDRDSTSGMRVLSAPTKIPEWEPSERVTLLGDAVHVMSPSGGVGATAALNDACLLSELLATDGISKETMARYENGMRKYAAMCVSRSNAAATRMLNVVSKE